MEGKNKGDNMKLDGDDTSWFSETTKTVIIAVTMIILVGGMGWGYYEAHQWKADRQDAKAAAKMEMQLEILLEPVQEQLKQLESDD